MKGVIQLFKFTYEQNDEGWFISL